MPHAKLLTFEHADPVDLEKVLPHMPALTRDDATGHACSKPSPFDLLDRLLQCSPSARMTSAQALEHPWFDGEDIPLLYPEAFHKQGKLWRGRALGHWFLDVLGVC